VSTPINGPELLKGFTVLASIFGYGWYRGFLLFEGPPEDLWFIALFTFIGWFAISAVFGVLKKYLPPLTLDEEYVKSGMLMTAKLHRQDIRQIYTAVVNIQRGNSHSFEACNVCVFTRDGEQSPLIGPVKNLEVGLAAEEILEKELGLFNLNVFGDNANPGSPFHPASAAEETVPRDNEHCDTCGSEVQFDEESRDVGYALCPHCQHITLYYAPGGEPILGPGDRSHSSGNTVQEEGGMLQVASDPAFFVDSDRKLVGWNPGQNEMSLIPFDSIAHVGVRSVGGFTRTAGLFKGLKSRMAHSGDITGGSLLLSMAGVSESSLKFSVVLHLKEGHPRVIVEDISNPSQAISIQRNVLDAIGQ
jgi:hypothetical protein